MIKTKKKMRETQRLLTILLIIAVSLSFILGGFIIYDKLIKPNSDTCSIARRG